MAMPNLPTNPQAYARSTILTSFARIFTWGASSTEAVHKAMVYLSLAFDRPLTKEMLMVYAEALADLTGTELQTAFSRAMTEETFWPAPAKLRSLSGRNNFDAVVKLLATATLDWLIERIRKHGVRGTPAGGVYEDSLHPDTGAPVRRVIKAPQDAPALTPAMERALAYLGGTELGLGLIALHPALSGWSSESMFTAEKIERRWLDAYRLAYRGTEEQ